MIDSQAVIDPSAKLADDVEVGPFSIIGPNVEIGEGSIIGPHVVIKGPTTIGKRNRIYQFSSVGEDTPDLKYKGEPTTLVMGDYNTIREGVTIHRGTIQDRSETTIGNHNLLMAYAHVGHDSVIGDRCILVNNVALAGHVWVGDWAILAGYAMVAQYCRVGAHSFTGAAGFINQDVPAYVMASGNPAEPKAVNVEGLKRRNFSKEQIRAINRAFKALYRRGLPLDEAVEKLEKMAAEASGDQLGADLIAALRKRYPATRFEGIGGEKMIAEGFNSLYPMERLSVMGLVEPLKRLPELLRIRSELFKHFRNCKPALFMGIDSPDFTIHLEGRLRRCGINTAHYVSPSVWAWRQGRVKTIARNVDHILTLFPFESDFYRQHQVPETCVGHSLADQLPMETDVAAARTHLEIAAEVPLVAILPGSRGSEVALLGQLFLQVAQKLATQVESIQFVIPAANTYRREQIDQLAVQYPQLNVTVLDGNALTAMAAADVVLMASGTATLEAMLLKKPMVVSYRMGKISYGIFSRLVKVPHVALPNLLAGERLVPELIQNDATIDNISAELLGYLQNPVRIEKLQTEFGKLHQLLRRNASESAADALAPLIEGA